MKDIFENSIRFEDIGNYAKEQLFYDIKRAAISKDGKTLYIAVLLNFIIPYEAHLKIEDEIKCRIPQIEGIRIEYIYENIIMTEEEITKYAIGHIIGEINGSFAAITRTIRQDDYILSGDELIIKAIGDLAVSTLNREVSPRFENFYLEHFGLKRKVIFENHIDVYEETKKEMAVLHEAELECNRIAQENAAKNAPRQEERQTSQFGGDNYSGRKRRPKYQPVKGNIIMGSAIKQGITSLGEISVESGNVAAEGVLFKKTMRPIKNDRCLVTLLITDKRTSLCVKCFTGPEKWQDIDVELHEGDFIKIKGETQWDTYENVLVVMASSIEKGKIQLREDNAPEKRVELHLHTKMSRMDGLNEVAEIVKVAARWGQPAIAITDHAVVQSFPDAAGAAAKLKKAGKEIKILYGLEGYVFDDKDCIKEDGTIDYRSKPTNHIILLAKNQEGLKNIYKLVSYSHIDYFYKRPRLPKSVISAHREGIIIGSACEAGEVYRAVLDDLPLNEIEEIASFYDYLEIQPLVNNRFMIEKGIVPGKERLMEINKKIVELADRLGKPAVATTDAHYSEPEDAIYRNILFAGQGYKDAESGEGLYMRTTDEMLEEFSYLGEETAYRIVVENTKAIADSIADILPVPKGKFPPKIENADEILWKTCMEKAHSIYGDPLPELIEERLHKELNSIISNGYSVMYVSAQMLVEKSLADGYIVGSRGSVGSSFAATMAGITEVNPLEPHYICPKCKHLIWGDEIHERGKYDCGVDMPEMKCPKCGEMMNQDGFTIPFATFLGFDGDKEPDIDLNFAGEYQATAHKYVDEIFGEKNVFKAGTIGTIADKTAYGFVMKYFEEKGHYVNKFEIDRLVKNCTGVKRTTGQHPGGIIIVPDDHEIYEFCPVQRPANAENSEIITTHFDYHKIDKNLLKLDILGHDIPSMLHHLQDMTGVDPLSIPLKDEKVNSIFNGTEELDIKDPDYKFTHGSFAVPEFGTAFVRRMLDDTKPSRFADLVRISGFSHGTDVWLNNAQELIRNGTANMSEVISTRDDIMNYLILKGIPNKTSFKIMEDVRKNRPLSDEQLEIMKEHNVPEWYVISCKRIQYMFPRAHAVAYVMMSYRMAWFKVYYPTAFYASYFTMKVSNFSDAVIMKGKDAVLARIDEIAAKGKGATTKENDEVTVLEVAYEMYARGYEFLPARLGKSQAKKFICDEGKVRIPFRALEGIGDTAAESLDLEYRLCPYETVEEISLRTKVNKSAMETLRIHGVLEGLQETDQISMF
ncbi:MAG: PolC-type DNA polymerase III [Eubacteriales bacterium]|nr:PolC-type DNA polymerase III [Eubacteriales bacterium]